MVSPQPTRTVSGQVFQLDGQPLSPTGLTVRAFDATTNRPLGNAVALQPKGTYLINYTWQVTPTQKRPNLLVRILNPQGMVVGEARKDGANPQDVLNITVNFPAPPPPTFTLYSTVKQQNTNTTLPNLRVEAIFRSNNQTLLTLSGTTSDNGAVPFTVERSVFSKLPSGQSIEVTFQVYQDKQQLQTSTTIPKLQLEDQKVEILVTIPAPPKNYLVKGTVKQSNGAVLAGAIVHVDDVKRGDRLGTTKTNNNSYYEIRYTLAAEAGEPDLVVSVYNEQGQQLAVSPRKNNAQLDETINLTVPILEPEPTEEIFVVKGHIRQADGIAVEGIVVRAYDRDLRSEQLLGQKTTDTIGYYEIPYTRAQFRRAEKENADLVLRLFSADSEEIQAVNLTTDDGTPLEGLTYSGSSDNSIRIFIWFNAPPVAIINATVADKRYQGLSEYERNINELTPLLETVSIHELVDADIQFLSREINIPYEQIDFLRLDPQWSSEYDVESAIFYGLLRQGLSRNLRQLLSEKPSRWRTALQAALDANIIPARRANDLNSSIERLSELAVNLAFEPSSDPSDVPLGVKLATSSLSSDVQQQVVTFVLQYEGDDIWQALQEQGNLTTDALNTVRFTLESDTLLMGHLATLQAVQQLQQSRSWQSTRDLAQLKRSDWEQITTSTTPNGLPNGFETSQAYADAIASGIEQTFPTDVFRYRLAEENDQTNSDMLAFLASNPDFDLLRTPINTFLNNGAELGQVSDLEALPSKLKTLSRVARLTPDRNRYQLTQGLIRQGYDSAVKIASVGKEEFVGNITPIAGPVIAENLYENARVRTDAANIHLLRLRDYLSDRLPVLPNPQPTGELAEWTTIFGSLNACQCKHCRSVYSPAAYLVDMLEFLKKVCLQKDARGRCTRNLQQVLFNRRPDIRDLKLDCDNSNTPLPHIDLVNELLEKYVAPETIPEGWPYQTVGSTEEGKTKLRAIPAYEHRPAYDKLAVASYPWLLPFDLNHERSQLFAKNLNINLWEIRQIFNRDEQEIARFSLGLNPKVWEYTSTPQRDAARLAECWGLANITVWADREPVPHVLSRTGLTYQDLVKLLDTHFFTRENLSLDASADPCNIDRHFLVKRPGISSNDWLLLLDRLHRFLRLRQALGWSIEKLDTLLHARGQIEIIPNTLTDFVRVMQIAKRLRLSEIQVAQLDSTKLATALRIPPTELQRYVRLFNLGDLFPSIDEDSETRRVDTSLLVQFLDTYDLLRQTSFDPAELLYLLKSEDLVPAVYTLTESMKDSMLQALYSALRTVDPNYLEQALPPIKEALISLIRGFRSEFFETSEPLGREIFRIAYNYIVERFQSAIDSDAPDLVASLPISDVAVDWFSSQLDLELGPEERDRQINLFQSQYPRLLDGFWTRSESIELYRRTYIFLGEYLEDTVRRHLWNEQSTDGEPASSLYEFIVNSERDAISVELRPTYTQIVETYAEKLQQFSQQLDGMELAIIEHLSTVLSIPAAVVSRLLLPHISLDGTTLTPAILHFIDPATGEISADFPAIRNFISLIRKLDTESDPMPRLVSQLPSEYDSYRESAKRLLIRLTKAARFVQVLNLSSREVEIGSHLSASIGLLDFNLLPVAPTSSTEYLGANGWIRIKQLQANMPRSDRDIFDFLSEAHQNDSTLDSLLETLIAETGWDIGPKTGDSIDAIRLLQTALGEFTKLAFQQISTYEKLHQAIQWMHKEKLSPTEVVALGTGDLATVASTLIIRAEAQYGDDKLSWYKALTPINDQLRERKRDALIAYLLANPPKPELRSTNDLYAHLLIDVEMSACQMTSRIVQAHSAIQLFVQRCRMNLEQPEVLLGDAVTDSEQWKQWQWMKNYRVWEAARKVFLYPENWIEPDLRDNKSPFCKELENELLQDDVTQESVERAYRNYFDKLDQVSRLDVRGVYEEEWEDDKKILHVIARTYSEPHIYFYRKRMPNRVWTAWEKIDLSLEGNHVFPVVHNGRLMLFWAVFSEEDSFWRLKIQWSIYHDQKWQSPQSNETPFIARFQLRKMRRTEKGFFPNNFSFRVTKENETNQLQIILFTSNIPDTRRDESGRDRFKVSQKSFGYSLAYFSFDSCKQRLRLETSSRPIRFLLSPNRGEEFVDLQKFVELYPDNIGFVGISNHSGKLVVGTKKSGNDFIPYNNIPYVDDKTLTESEFNQLYEVVSSSFGERPKWSEALAILDVFDYRFEVIGGIHDIHFDSNHQFFLENESCSYLITSRIQYRLSRKTTSPIFTNGFKQDSVHSVLEPKRKFYFETFYHPYLCKMVETFNNVGLDGLLNAPVSDANLHRQLFKEPRVQCKSLSRLATRFNCYLPTELVWRNENDPYDPYPYEQFDFSFDGAYSIYNWELFFHIPLLVADRLTKNQRFEEAQRWFHYIFDPIDVSIHPSPQKFWQIKPFFEEAQRWSGSTETLEEMMRRLATGAEDIVQQVEAWRDDPFNPHLIARLRLVAYMKTVVQKYLENLIAWGDHLFLQDTRESINEAVQLYILAAEILGSRPVTISRDETTPRSYRDIAPSLDALSNVLVDIETSIPPRVRLSPSRPKTEIPPNLVLYFCIPSNEKLLGYWDTISDRLFKIRNCMDIEGQVRQLPLFAPPIDPALLVRARAAGLDLGAVISGVFDLRLPHYRYQVLIQKAMEFCGEVRSLGGALLSALEKKDAEDLGLLRSRHEISMMKLIALVKQQQIEEAKETLEGLRASRRLAEARLEFYSRNASEFRSPSETVHVNKLNDAHTYEMIGHGFQLASAVAHIFPQITASFPPAVEWGGTNLGNSLDAVAAAFRIVSAQLSFDASMASLQAGHERRRDEWNLQADLAQKELDQIDKQILAAEIRLTIAEKEQSNHEKQIEQAEEVERFLKSKFTNSQLYSWMVAQLSALHYQAYRMAFDIAKKTEKAAQFELGLESSEFNYIQFGHWDSQKKGLLAGERLHQDLRRMELAYLDKNKRELELTKHISLINLNPLALIAFKETGICEIELLEPLFDLDYPGHYMRRIKTVSLTIPCVTGAYTNVNCTLTLLTNKTRIKNIADDGYGTPDEDEERFVTNFAAMQSIATSSAQNDSGLFELNFRDERYLPFEGAGVISSRWRIELSGKWDTDDGRLELPQFDFNTISDVILHLRYTAREGGELLKGKAIAHLRKYQSEAAWLRMFNLRQEFPTQWHRFLHPIAAADGNVFELEMSPNLFPIRDRGKTLKINTIGLLARGTDAGNYEAIITFPDNSQEPLPLASVNQYGDLHFYQKDVTLGKIEIVPAADPLIKWQLKIIKMSRPGDENLQEGPVKKVIEVEDVLLVLGYKWE
ncbi:neuraminidase-like domain-containing protein [Laspinema sp. D1]|uniref:Tc toxin subunit A-related protein n=1 Tax=Laspinema palackyanum TaxID=3231601 RepID=UPI00349B9FA8|nr:neuraminidase-like domain-containing protein [Laspinema sp. D2b]